ncbi:hypothetical protein [Vampirovibrio sp.]|uniref:hypothetical protein n=1 Tax=Vampirovibrio sp. TaxID=2717857 RepID=UPI00359310F8
MALQNVKKTHLKKKTTLHEWPLKNDLSEKLIESDQDLELESLYTPEIIYQNELGEYYALQDYEE